MTKKRSDFKNREDWLDYLEGVADEQLTLNKKGSLSQDDTPSETREMVKEYATPSFFSKRGLAQRGVAAAKGAVSGITELPYLPYNLYRAVQGREPISTGAPEYLEKLEQRYLGDKLRPRTRGEQRVENFWRGVGDYATFATGAGGLARGVGKAAAKMLPKLTKKMAPRLIKGGKDLARSGRSPLALGIAGTSSEVIPELTREMDPAFALPTAFGASMVAGKTGRLLADAPRIPHFLTGASPKKLTAFKESGLPGTLGDVSPRLAAFQAWAHRASPSKRMGKIHAKRAQYLKENFPYEETLESAASKFAKGAEARHAFRSRQQKRYTALRDKKMEDAGVRTFLPAQSIKMIEDYYDSLKKLGIKNPEARLAKSRLGKIMYEISGREGMESQMAKLKKSGFNLDDYPSQVQEQILGELGAKSRSIPIGEAQLAESGLMDRLNALSAWEKKIGLSKSERLARELRDSLSKDIGATYEKVVPGIEKPRKAAWAQYKGVEEPALELALTENQLPEDTIRKITTNFMKGGGALPLLLKHLPHQEQKSMFNMFLQGMSHYGKTSSLNQLAKVYNYLDTNQQKFIIDGISKYNNIPKGKFESLLKSLEDTKFTQSMANVSGTASHNQISEAIQSVMNAGKEAASGNKIQFVDGMKTFFAHVASFLTAGVSQNVLGSQKLLNSLEYLGRIKSPNQVPIGLHKLKEAGVSPKLIKIYQDAWRTGLSVPQTTTAKRAQELGMAYQTYKKREKS